MYIKTITPIDKRRSKVVFDEDFALVLYKGELKKYNIKEGGELLDETYDDILHKVLFKRACERAVHILKASDKTENELRKKLTDGGYPIEAAEYAIERMKEHHYVDDERYCEKYIDTYGKKRSIRRLEFDLKNKGIPDDIIKSRLDTENPDEEEQIRALLKKKGYDKESSRDIQNKLIAFLGRKGYSYEVIIHTMRDYEDL